MAILVGLFAYNTAVRELRRTRTMEKVAHGMGASFVKRDTGVVQQALAPFPLIRDTRFRTPFSVIHARTGGVEIIVFDYHYTKRVHGIYRRGPQTETVIALHVPGCSSPRLLSWYGAQWNRTLLGTPSGCRHMPLRGPSSTVLKRRSRDSAR